MAGRDQEGDDGAATTLGGAWSEEKREPIKGREMSEMNNFKASVPRPALHLDVLVSRSEEGPYWIAHCLQIDCVGTGESPDAAYEQAVRTAIDHVAYALATDNLENLIQPPDAALLRQLLSARAVGQLTYSVARTDVPDGVSGIDSTAAVEIQRAQTQAEPELVP